MKNLLPLLLALLAGCMTSDKIMLDATHRKPTQTVELIKSGEKPSRHYTEIATYSVLGLPEEESKAIRHFLAEARKDGAHAIVLEPSENAGLRYRYGTASALGVPHRIFKATAVIYTTEK